MKIKKEMYIIIFSVLVLLSSYLVYAVYGTPTDYTGTVKIDGVGAPVGTVIITYCINGTTELNFANETVSFAGNYGLLSVRGDDDQTSDEKDGCLTGDNVTFKVKDNGEIFDTFQSAIFDAGETIVVNLAVNDTIAPVSMACQSNPPPAASS